jgi:hypothetical protein
VSEQDDDHPELVEVPAGNDPGILEVVVARLESDGIPARIVPDPSSLNALDEERGGFRILLRREDLEAALPVFQAAGLDDPNLA